LSFVTEPLRPKMPLPLPKIVSFIFLSLLFSGQLLLAELPKGMVKFMNVKGDVSALKGTDDQKLVAHNGQILDEGYTVTTGDNGSCVLVFSNGSTLVVSSNTSLSIASFRQESFDDSTRKFELLDADPSESTSDLILNYGQLLADVKKLSKKSSFKITTQAGVAGIRGTIADVSFVMDTTTGSFVMKIINVVGSVTSTAYNVSINSDGLQEVEKIVSELNVGAKTTSLGNKDLASGNIATSESRTEPITQADKNIILEAIRNANITDQGVLAALNAVIPAIQALKEPAKIQKNAQKDLQQLEQKTQKAFQLSAETQTVVALTAQAVEASSPQAGVVDNSIVNKDEFVSSPADPE